ncbi:hypothetical protein TanjilG_08966 [Lupinus angustifolius]|uniref:WAT1-related protein n=1 Tax=Lupinus angustifolius TaxID=3871 RepID=A0A4P1QPA7_LUPAN|nr:hypothetical protein TanjilG_08966 [Lupinus angustifolius]
MLGSMEIKNIWNVVHGLKAVLLMVMVQIAFGGVNVLYKLAVNDGMDLRVVVAYRLVFATSFIAPLALILESLERLNLRTRGGKGKIVGTLTGIGGAMVLTFVKGVEINMRHVNLLHHSNGVHEEHSSSGGKSAIGALCALASGISYALWLIIQAKMSEKYPSHYSSTALMSLWGSLISIVFALSLERDWTQWRLGWNIRLLTVAYSGIVVSGVMVTVISWCIRMRGPLFASVFSPLMLVIVALAGCTLLNEKLHLGRPIQEIDVLLQGNYPHNLQSFQ